MPFLVAAGEREIVGYVIARGAADEGEILNLAVAPQFRRRGVGCGLGRAILELLEHPGGAARMGEAGHAFWKRGHTPAAVARWHEALYAELAARAGGAAR